MDIIYKQAWHLGQELVCILLILAKQLRINLSAHMYTGLYTGLYNGQYCLSSGLFDDHCPWA